MNNLKQNKYLANLGGDILGGLMTTVVALPVAMAFGVASGLGAAAGLYGAMAGGLFAAVFGGTKGQQSGPTGPIAVVIASLVATYGPRFDIVFACTIMGGLFQILFGRLGLGRIINYTPYPVVSGFMTGIACIIIVIHIHPLFGLHGSKKISECLMELGRIPAEYSAAALGVGLSTMALIFAFKKLSKKLPASLLALLVATVASVLLNLDVPRIGTIPDRLPMPSLPAISFADVVPVLVGGITIGLLGSIDSLLTSLIADKITGTRHNSDKELTGQGIANVVIGLLGGLAGAGSTTRTLANIDAGGRTPLSGVVYGLLVLAVISGLGQYAALVPLASLAGILIWLGVGIVDWRMMKHLRIAPREDVIVMFTVLGMTLFVDLIWAIVVGAALACVLLVRKFTVSNISRFGFLETLSDLSANVPDLEHNTVFVYEFGQPLFFAEAKKLHDTLEVFAASAKIVILNFERTVFIDQSACYVLEENAEWLSEHGIQLWIVGLDRQLKDLLGSMGCVKAINPTKELKSMREAIELIGPDNAVALQMSRSD